MSNDKELWESLYEKPDWHKVDDSFRPDLSSIEFPTDRITIGQMRQHQRTHIECDLPMRVAPAADLLIFEVARAEHIIAKRAWAAAIGLPDPAPGTKTEYDLPFINDVYKTYGLSEGGKSTEELIRRIETQAARAAKLSVGEGRV